MDKHIIFGIHITDRIKHIGAVQNLLSEYGCYIKTRLGLHETSKNACSPNGLLILEMLDDDKEVNEFAAKLMKIEGVELQKMIFNHP